MGKKFILSTANVHTLNWEHLYYTRFEFENSIESLRRLTINVKPNVLQTIESIKMQYQKEIESSNTAGDEDYSIYLQSQFLENKDYVLVPMLHLSYQSIFITAYSLLESYLKKLVEFTWDVTSTPVKDISKRDFVKSYCLELKSISSVQFQDLIHYIEIQGVYKEIRHRFTHEMGSFEESKRAIFDTAKKFDGLSADEKKLEIRITSGSFVLEFLKKIEKFYSKLIDEHDKAAYDQ